MYKYSGYRLFFYFFVGIVGVEIRHMRVPSVLESGSRPYVILDCDYDLNDSEGHQVEFPSPLHFRHCHNPQPPPANAK